VQTDKTSKGLRDSEEERGEPQRFKFLCHGIGVTATQALTCRPMLNGHYACMMQDGLQIAGPLGGGGGVPRCRRASRENWLSCSLALRSQL
jgi:hypothetical protein